MAAPEQLSCRDDVDSVVREAFPMEVERFCLFAPPEEDVPVGALAGRRQIRETDDGLFLVVDALIYRANDDRDGKRVIESIREQSVRLISRAAMPIERDRFANYLRAVEKCLGEQDFESLAALPPSRWFTADILEIRDVRSVDDFHRLIAASLPAPKSKVPAGPALGAVLLEGPRLPNLDAVQKAYAALTSDGTMLHGHEEGDEILRFELGNGASLYVTLMPVAIPATEVDAAAGLSVARMLGRTPRTSHLAHLLVALDDPGKSPVDRWTTLVRCAAALADASGALGVYLGNGVAHPAEFFIEQARAPLPITLLCGVVLNGSRQILSRGMGHLGLSDLLLTTKRDLDGQALAAFFKFIALLVERGTPIPAGDTVGRDAHERLRVRYAPSPLDPSVPVWTLEM